MRIRKDITGYRFGRLTVLSRVAGSRWSASCDCGQVRIVSRPNLVSGHTRSCGCLMREIAATINASHGGRRRDGRSPAYNVWAGMLKRCRNKRSPNWPDYGGRGITVCERWRDFAAFESDMGPRPSMHHTLERRDNDGPYSPDNCYWATHIEQGRNRRVVRLRDIDGNRLGFRAAAHMLAMPESSLRLRLLGAL